MSDSFRAFAELVAVPDDDIDLSVGALLVGQVEHPSLVPSRSLTRLDELATGSGAAGVPDPVRVLHRLREFLFEDQRFRGDRDDYYDPRNSCLDCVLARRRGIPITLSVVFMEVGRRVGLQIAGIGLPGHFVVSARVGEDRVLLDPFDGGAVVTAERAHDLVARATGRAARLTEAAFAPCSKRQILARMLNNLKAVYATRGEWVKAVAVMDRLIAVDPAGWVHVRDRGSMLVKAGDFERGLADWERYLTGNPGASDVDSVLAQLRRVRQGLAVLN